MSDGRIAKLPRWAQDRIRHLERQLSDAQALACRLTGAQPKSPVSTQDIQTGTDVHYVTRYFPVGLSLDVDYAGIHLEISLRGGSGGEAPALRFQYEAHDHRLGAVALIPESFQSFRLVAGTNLVKS